MSEEKNIISKNNELDLSKVIAVKNYYLKEYDCYVNGYINKETNKPAYEHKKLTSYYYICKDCGEIKTFVRLRKFKTKKCEFGNLCQKCTTKRNAQKEEFKEKEKIATKKGWEEGRYQHLKDSGYFLEWGRKYCKNILEKSEEEKAEIAAKKINTWLSHSEEEKAEINFKRAKPSRERHQFILSNLKFKFPERFATKEWRKMRTFIINRDKFTCQKCKKVMKKKCLQVHHIIPYRICGNNEADNLISLCKSCHSKVERFLEKNCILEGNEIDVKKELEFIYENKRLYKK